jgi:ferrous iron transport protein A
MNSLIFLERKSGKISQFLRKSVVLKKSDIIGSKHRNFRGAEMVLSEAQNGSSFRIEGFLTPASLSAKLRQLGLVPGDTATLIRQAPFDGPYLLNIRGREIALGKSIAARVLIEVVA